MNVTPDFMNSVHAVLAVLILAGTLVGFIREKLPPDLVALLGLIALLLTGVLSPAEAFSGFSHPATVSVAAVLVLSAGLERAGALNYLARHVLAPIGHSEWLLTAVLMVAIGLLSAFINNTAAVAVFIPVVLELCRRSGARPGRLLMPMAMAATLGGLCTLIGTSTNLVAHEVALFAGFQGFTMFELGQVGVPVLIAGFLYILLIGRWMLPAGPVTEAAPPERLGSYVSEFVVLPDSQWIGRDIKTRQFRHLDLELLDVVRDRKSILALEPNPKLQAGDRLRMRGPLEDLLSLPSPAGLRMRRPGTPEPTAPAEATKPSSAVGPSPEAAAVGDAHPSNAGAADASANREPSDPRKFIQLPLSEMVVLPGSPLIGRSLRSLRFAERYNAVVLGLHRPGEPVTERPGNVPIRTGDVLVVEGESEALQALAERPGFLVVGAPSPPEDRPGKLLVALFTLAGVVLIVSLRVLPIVTAATAGCAVLMLTGCLRPREAYNAIDWRVIFVLAGALALGEGLIKTGVTASLGAWLASLTHTTGPVVVLAMFLLVTSVLSQVISNAATAALLAPVAIASAQQMGVNPMALLAAVAFGASASFATPIGYQTNLMIYGPGGYKFTDFVKVGLPMNALLILIALYLIPRYWPL